MLLEIVSFFGCSDVDQWFYAYGFSFQLIPDNIGTYPTLPFTAKAKSLEPFWSHIVPGFLRCAATQ